VTRSALIVAGSRYSDARLRQLRAPVSDAEQLAEVLADPAIGSFEVDVLLDQPEHLLRRKLAAFFGDRARDDLLLVHFSCHGVKDEDGSLYFATEDTDLGHLEASAVSAEFLNRLMNRSLSRQIIVLLDCCYAGAFGKGASARGGTGVELKERFNGRGRVVLTASTSMEYAFEGDDVTGSGSPSIFTKAIVEGLSSGTADLDGDGRVSVDELYEHIYDRVRDATPNQTPGKWTYDVQGDLFVASNPHGPRAGTTEADPRPPTTTAVRVPAVERDTRFGALLRRIDAARPLRIAFICSTAGLLLFLVAGRTAALTTLGASPLHRLGTLAIGAGAVAIATLAGMRLRLAWAAPLAMALAIQESYGAAATLIVETSRDGEYLASRHRYVIAGGLAMAAAAAMAATASRRQIRSRRGGMPRRAPLVIASIGAGLTFLPLLSSPLTVDASGSIERLFYENPWYRLEPFGIAAASAVGILVLYRGSPRLATGWLAGTAVNTVLYAGGVAVFASSTFGGYGNEIKPSGLAWFASAALLLTAAFLAEE